MSDLETILPQLRDRIGRFRDQAIGEQNTKNSLIRPLLRALGWDVENPDEIWEEYKPKPSDNPVDVALMINGQPRLFVEAKALGQNLDDRKWANQIMGYAAVSGVEWVVLTDGNDYRIYNSHAVVPVEEKLFLSTRVTGDDRSLVETLKLMSKESIRSSVIDRLWAAHFVDRTIRTVIHGLVHPQPAVELVDLISRRAPKLSAAQIEASLARARIAVEFQTAPSADLAVPPGSSLIAEDRTRPHGVPTRQMPQIGNGEKKQREQTRSVQRQGKRPKAIHSVSLNDLIHWQLIEPPLQIERTYAGKRLVAEIVDDGTVVWNGRNYESLSGAANAACSSVSGRDVQLNGWDWWTFADDDGRYKSLKTLRERYYRRQAAM